MGTSRKKSLLSPTYDLFHVIHVDIEIMLPILGNIPKFTACQLFPNKSKFPLPVDAVAGFLLCVYQHTTSGFHCFLFIALNKKNTKQRLYS